MLTAFLSRIAHARIRRRQALLTPILAHGELLVGYDFQIGTGKCCTEQDESTLPILWEISDRVAGIERAGLQQPSSTCETPPLMTNRRQLDAGRMRCVPNMLIGRNR